MTPAKIPFEILDTRTPQTWEDFAISKADYDRWSKELSTRLPTWDDAKHQSFDQYSPWRDKRAPSLDPKAKVIIVQRFSGHCDFWVLDERIPSTELDCFPLQRIIREELEHRQSSVDIDL